MWHQLPGYLDYEYDEKKQIRKKSTGELVMRRPISIDGFGYSLRDNDGILKTVREKDIFPSEDDIAMEDRGWYVMKHYKKYEISPYGDIRNATTKNVLKPTINNYGYKAVTLMGDDGKVHCERIHRLVAEQFLSNPDNMEVVNHKDEDKLNNCVDNLEYVSYKENSNHGTNPKKLSSLKQKPINEYDENGKYIRTWNCAKSITEFYKTGDSAIRHCIKANIYCRGHLFRDYDGSVDNLKKSELPKHKPSGSTNHDFDGAVVPNKYLYTPEEMDSIQTIFRKYSKTVSVTNAQRLADFNTVIEAIEELRRSN